MTWTGANVLLSRFINSAGTYATEPKIIGWGLGGILGGPFVAGIPDVALFQEAPEARTTGASSLTTLTQANDTYTVTGTITCTQGGGETIAEVGLFDNTTKPPVGAVAAGGVVASSGATTLNTAATYTPGNNSFVQIRTEVMKVTAGSGSTALTVTRGQNGSAAISTIAVTDIVTAGDAQGLTTVGERCFLHASFTGLALNLNDSIAFTINVALVPQ
jgi:hypothetical protein